MRAGPNGYDEVPQFEVRKLMGRRFAIILAVMYVIEVALYGGAIVGRRTQEVLPNSVSPLPADSNVYINFRICTCFKFLKYYNTLEIVGVQMVGKCTCG